jgi:CheY-like chemotaxis protein
LRSKRTILLGEDDIDDQDFLMEVFTGIDDDISLMPISSGKKLIDKLEGLDDDALPCLIILDYNMPELNGAEILRILQKNKRYEDIPKLIWSTSGGDSYKELCKKMGAADYLVKPSSMSEFRKVAEYMLSYC